MGISDVQVHVCSGLTGCDEQAKMKGKIVKEKNRRKGNKKWILSYVFLLASN
jgi:hypothetical protein